ncbi:DUF952 domain-containing protein [Sporolactobacillus laevolacticus]|uniref:DUF952 domain-containing protein n=1 Tax=Sporolactobacillus laevolacticus TaxID=33018 RepID=UPI0025B3D913|nr:DUF952 domain-containing protein [Sporolactobacillus laevolacticus]MDN3955844.1 DUF952 domain-containing protein [Sporolactobacillus laevolacticus]
MIILHCLKQNSWEKAKNSLYYGKEQIEADGFIHCSSIENFWRVAPNFKNIKEQMLLLCIDTNKVESQIKWGDDDNCGREYPHIYGELNTDAIVNVVPFLRDEQGNFVLNEELKSH